MRPFKAMVAGLSGAALLLLSACATSFDPPQDQRSRAALAIEQAEDAGAAEYAPLALREAKISFDKGETLMADEQNESAYYAFVRAEADAETAENQAEAEKTAALAKEAEEGVETLNSEIRRKERMQ